MARSSIGLSLFDSFYRAGLQTNNPAKGLKSSFIKPSPFHNNKVSIKARQTQPIQRALFSPYSQQVKVAGTHHTLLASGPISCIEANIYIFFLFLESRYYSFWLVLIGQSIRSAGPFLALRNPFHLRWGSRLPARQIRMQELELLYPQHPSKRDAFTRAFHQKEAFLQSAPLPLFCGSRRNKHRVVSGLLY